jgi:bacillithiol biosynthesis cysteine-adding enzyme BshC
MAQETVRRTTAAGTMLIPSQNLDYTRLYLDFISGQSPAVDFYPSRQPSAIVGAVASTHYERDHLAEILCSQNTVFRASEATLKQIERLRDPRAVCIFAGQQAGLFSGPLFTIIKALGIIRLARIHEERLGRPVIPIFWIAGDDHDFAEVNHIHVLPRTGQVHRIEYRATPNQALPAADIKLDDRIELDRVLAELGECLGQTDLTAGLFDLLKSTYTPDDTLVSSFGKFMAALTSELGLVLFNPSDPEIKRLAVPFFETVLDEQELIHKTLDLTNDRLRQSGYHLQVEKKDTAAHLFCNLEGRLPIMRDGDMFIVGGHRFSRTEMSDLLAARPEIFSPDVMTRPLMQAWLFPVLAQIGGPSEIAYFAQLNGLFSLVNRPVPVYCARPSVTLLERKIEQTMREMNIAFEDVRGDIEQIVNRVLGETFPADLQKESADLRHDVEERFRRFVEQILGFDSGLKETAEQVRGKIDFQLNGLEAKIFAAHKKKSQQARERIYRVGSSLYPNRTPQERCLNVSGFLARHGFGIVRYIYEHMDAEQTAHQLISLGEYEV